MERIKYNYDIPDCETFAEVGGKTYLFIFNFCPGSSLRFLIGNISAGPNVNSGLPFSSNRASTLLLRTNISGHIKWMNNKIISAYCGQTRAGENL